MKFKKIIIRFLSLILLMVTALSNTGYMAHAQEVNINSTNGDVVIFAEETEWRFRVVDGQIQKRLWSLTWGKWLTEWEWV
ncbi:hypothetical protein HZF24_08055 [Sedimentibacter hydroxybenzoicus DSM 7310]|uniref:Uncharacterized protein n=1 Tax=Sedimentibacter hydroxybenzoicus DSM 7310 TaxID=1123245 RepID=A0A974GW48_SEDHY|nr:hypothetical protein [Sedimentibacter hydroxybenzoicus]NYB74094.1 hypothetical protein [Sedimentibacter hydroxybenzoicus DSM 7310]